MEEVTNTNISVENKLEDQYEENTKQSKKITEKSIDKTETIRNFEKVLKGKEIELNLL